LVVPIKQFQTKSLFLVDFGALKNLCHFVNFSRYQQILYYLFGTKGCTEKNLFYNSALNSHSIGWR
jgi:hypothetical protein